MHTAEMMSLPDFLDDVSVVRHECVRCSVVTAVASTVVRVVTLRSYDPIVPAQFLEAHVEPLLAALVAGVRTTVQRPPPHPFCRRGLRMDHQKRPVRVSFPVTVPVEDMDVPITTTRTVDK